MIVGLIVYYILVGAMFAAVSFLIGLLFPFFGVCMVKSEDKNYRPRYLSYLLGVLTVEIFAGALISGTVEAREYPQVIFGLLGLEFLFALCGCMYGVKCARESGSNDDHIR